MKAIFTAIAIAISLVTFKGCAVDNKLFAYMEYYADPLNPTMWFNGQKRMCEDKPDSIFCTTPEPIDNIQPDMAYVYRMLQEHRKRFSYKSDGIIDTWFYKESIYNYLKGDCEDKAMTMIQWMIDDGIDPKYLALCYILIKEDNGDINAHMFVGVNTSDGGWRHVDYFGSGQPLREDINWHMRMTDTGDSYTKWIKGGIK